MQFDPFDPFDRFDPFDQSAYLMTVFDRTAALDPAIKERIRHKVWARVNEVKSKRFDDIAGLDVEEYLIIGSVLTSPVAALSLGILWSPGHGVFGRFCGVAIALLVLYGSLILISEQAIKKIYARVPYLKKLLKNHAILHFLIIDAGAVLVIRSIPPVSRVAPQWLFGGLRAGLVGAIILISGFSIGWITSLLFNRMDARVDWSKHPEASIVKCLLSIIDNLESLETLRKERDEFILKTIARKKQREDLVKGLREKGVKGINVSTSVKKLKNGTFLETYVLQSERDDGVSEVVLQEENVSPTKDIFHRNPMWRAKRQNIASEVEKLARYIERGLPTQLSVGSARLDAWLGQELRGRAQTVRGWAQQLAFPSKSNYEDLLVQVGVALEYVAEEQWAAILKSDVTLTDPIRQRLLPFARNVVVGVIPLVAIIAASAAKIPIPKAIIESLLTFAIPWTLIQIIVLISPTADDYLGHQKNIRDILQNPLSKYSKAPEKE